MSENNETLLIPKSVLKWYLEKLKDKPDNWSICPECEFIFDDRYEACKCKRMNW